MALFDRDYDRDYGRRWGYGARGRYDAGLSGTGRYLWNETQDESREGWNATRRAVSPDSARYDRGLRGRARHLWNEVKDETREGWNAARRAVTPDSARYDRDLGGTGRYLWNETRDESREGWNAARRSAGRPAGRYDRGLDTGAYYGTAGYGAARYGRDYGTSYRAATEYDRGYKSRAQTDYGDPFGDRASHTPMRMVDESHGRGWRGYDRDYGPTRWGAGARYDRGFRDVSDEGRYRGVGYDPYAGGGYARSRYDRDWF